MVCSNIILDIMWQQTADAFDDLGLRIQRDVSSARRHFLLANLGSLVVVECQLQTVIDDTISGLWLHHETGSVDIVHPDERIVGFE